MKFRFKKIIFPVITSLLIFSSFPPPVSCRFFPNTSSIPRNFPALNPNFTTAWNSFRNLTGCRAGEKLDGLSKLKKYFRHFGYIPDADGNLTDLFDNSLESAVETYQRNFNLNVTGQLDDRTIRQIVLPRCGNADIVNGSTTMKSGGRTPANTTGRIHAVERYSFFPGMPRWPASRRNLTYSFFPGNQVSREVKSVFAAAFHRWSEVAPLTFTETEDYSNTDIRVGFFGGDHGDGDAFDGVSGTLAHALEPPSGRLHLDEAENWVLSGDIEVATGKPWIWSRWRCTRSGICWVWGTRPMNRRSCSRALVRGLERLNWRGTTSTVYCSCTAATPISTAHPRRPFRRGTRVRSIMCKRGDGVFLSCWPLDIYCFLNKSVLHN